MWFILDKNQRTVGVLDNSLPLGCPVSDDRHKAQLENGYSTLEFMVPTQHDTAKVLETEGYIIYTEDDIDFELFRIKDVHEVHGDESTKKVSCENSAVSDLLGEIIRPITFHGQNLKQVMDVLLQNTGWDVGDIYFEDVVTIEYNDYPTALSAINTAISQFDAEFEFRVEFDGIKIKRKVVNFYKKKGTSSKIIFEYGENLTQVTRTENTEHLVTAMIGVGKSDYTEKPLTIQDAHVAVEDGYEKVNDYVGSLDALQRWGKNGKHIFGVHRSGTAKTAVELYHETLRELKRYSKPILNYEVDPISLEKVTGYDFRKVTVGDDVVIKDTTFTPPLYLDARVIEKTTSTSDPEAGGVILGEFRPIPVSSIAIVRELQSQIRRKEGRWDNAEDLANDAKDRADEAWDKAEDAIGSIGDKADKDYVDEKIRESEDKTQENIFQKIKIHNHIRNSDFKNGTTRYQLHGNPLTTEVSVDEFTTALHAQSMVTDGMEGVTATILNPNYFLNKRAKFSFYAIYSNVIQSGQEADKFNAGVYYLCKKADGSTEWIYPTPVSFTGTNLTWDRHTQDLWFTGNGKAVEILEIKVKVGLENCKGEIWVTGMQLEEGEKVTPWMAHPQDIIDLTVGYVEAQVATREVGIPKSTFPPTNPAMDSLWLDTSKEPNRLRRWNGSDWVYATPTELIELDGQITSTQIADNSITTPKIRAGAVTANEIASRTITANEIASNAITSDKILAGAITTAHMEANSIDASVLRAGTLTADMIFGGTISGVNINVSTDVKVGNRLYLGSLSEDGVAKSIYFNNQANITGGGGSFGANININAETTKIVGDNLDLTEIANIRWGSNAPVAVFG